jgi:PhnB protein
MAIRGSVFYDGRGVGPRPMTLHLYVPDVDAAYKHAIAAGGKSLSAPRNQFYGERNGGVVDA